jgi:hypothetical protein
MYPTRLYSQREQYEMGLAYNTYLNSSKIYGCKTCKAHLANHDEIVSRVRLLPCPTTPNTAPYLTVMSFTYPSSLSRHYIYP